MGDLMTGESGLGFLRQLRFGAVIDSVAWAVPGPNMA